VREGKRMTIITPYRISVTDAVLADPKARRRNH